MIKRAIVTGAAGFSGAVLTEELQRRGIEVCAVLRPGSPHNKRLSCEKMIELEPERYCELPGLAGEGWDIFFHLMWTGERSMPEQVKNIGYSLDALISAKQCGCRRFVCTGSQAEYGVVPPGEVTDEDRRTEPFSAYGAAKVAACHLTKVKAKELDIEWIWGRIFSLIGKYEPTGRMLPDLFRKLSDRQHMELSSCAQNWDYLDVHDAADALIALGERGRDGEIYNIACGDYRPLKKYVEELEELTGAKGCGLIGYGADPDPFVSLQPSVKKLREDTDWTPKRSFADSIRDYCADSGHLI